MPYASVWREPDEQIVSGLLEILKATNGRLGFDGSLRQKWAEVTGKPWNPQADDLLEIQTAWNRFHNMHRLARERKAAAKAIELEQSFELTIYPEGDTMAAVLTVSRERANALFEQLGYFNPETWSERSIAEKLQQIHTVSVDDTELKTDEYKKLFAQIQGAGSNVFLAGFNDSKRPTTPENLAKAEKKAKREVKSKSGDGEALPPLDIPGAGGAPIDSPESSDVSGRGAALASKKEQKSLDLKADKEKHNAKVQAKLGGKAADKSKRSGTVSSKRNPSVGNERAKSAKEETKRSTTPPPLKTPKGPMRKPDGVVGTIINEFMKGTEDKPMTVDKVVSVLAKKFTDRDPAKMKGTVRAFKNWGRTEKGLDVRFNDKGIWVKQKKH